MADLLRDNNCSGCEFYDYEANDYFHQWCLHPEAEDHLQQNPRWPNADIREFVTTCPQTGSSPYADEE